MANSNLLPKKYGVCCKLVKLRRYAQLLDENLSLKVAQQLTCNVKMWLNSCKMAPANMLQSKFCEGDHAKTASKSHVQCH